MKIRFAGPLRAGRVEVGKIVKSQGIKGELKIHLYSGTVAEFEFKGLSRLLLFSGSEQTPLARDLLSCREMAAAVVVRLAGIENRDQAEQLRGLTVAVEPEHLPPLPEGEIYWHQLVGLAACDAVGQQLGTVTGLLPTAGHPILEITDSTGRELLVPVHAEFMSYQPATDTAPAHLRLTPPPGLLEIYR